MSINKDLLDHSHAHLFMFSLFFFMFSLITAIMPQEQSEIVVIETIWLTKSYLLSSSVEKKFADLCININEFGLWFLTKLDLNLGFTTYYLCDLGQIT